MGELVIAADLVKPGVKLYIAAVSGTIGVGKSTLLKLLLQENGLQKALPGTKVIGMQEPVDEWVRRGWLQKFYQDPEQHALAFQILVYKTHVATMQLTLTNAMKEAREGDSIVFLVERCMWDQLLFWKLQVELHKECETLQDEAYMQDWKLWKLLVPPMQRIFYCKTDTIEDTFKRVWQRGRKEEIGIAKSGEELPLGTNMGTAPQDWSKVASVNVPYLTALWNMHEKWYGGKQKPTLPVPITILDMSPSFHQEEHALDCIVHDMAAVILKDLNE